MGATLQSARMIYTQVRMSSGIWVLKVRPNILRRSHSWIQNIWAAIYTRGYDNETNCYKLII